MRKWTIKWSRSFSLTSTVVTSLKYLVIATALRKRVCLRLSPSRNYQRESTLMRMRELQLIKLTSPISVLTATYFKLFLLPMTRAHYFTIANIPLGAVKTTISHLFARQGLKELLFNCWGITPTNWILNRILSRNSTLWPTSILCASRSSITPCLTTRQLCTIKTI